MGDVDQGLSKAYKAEVVRSRCKLPMGCYIEIKSVRASVPIIEESCTLLNLGLDFDEDTEIVKNTNNRTQSLPPHMGDDSKRCSVGKRRYGESNPELPQSSTWICS